MPDTFTLTRPERQAIAFEVARTKYECAKTEYDRLWALNDAADEAHDEECPREGRYFSEYGLGCGMSRERVVDTLKWYAFRSGKPLPVEATADAFMTYLERDKECRKRLRVDELYEEARLFGDEKYFPARDALMAVPAPDNAALLVKIEIGAVSCDDDHLASIRDDARRLLTAEA